MTSSNGISATRTPHVGQVATLTLAPGKTVTYAYDAAGRPASVTDWLGGTTVFVHDAAGQLTGIERPSGVDTTLGYDAAGRIASIAHGALGAITITRDAAGRPATAVRDLPTAAAPASAASFTYDVASQVSGSGWNYDAMGRRTSGGGRSYAWDLASRLTQIVEGATTTTLGWDAFGRLVSLDRGATNRAYVWNYALPFPAIAIETEDDAPLRHFVQPSVGAPPLLGRRRDRRAPLPALRRAWQHRVRDERGGRRGGELRVRTVRQRLDVEPRRRRAAHLPRRVGWSRARRRPPRAGPPRLRRQHRRVPLHAIPCTRTCTR